MQMNISPISPKDGRSWIYIQFFDEDRSAEIRLPGRKVLSNNGFTEEEIQDLREYVKQHKDNIFSIAKKINVMDNFLGIQRDDQGSD